MLKEELRKLGITIAPSRVMEIIRHLQAGVSQHALQKINNNSPIASSHTVLKVKRNLDEGRLDFLINPKEGARLAMDKMQAVEQEELQAEIDQLKTASVDWASLLDLGTGSWRRGLVTEAAELLGDQWLWSVGNLEQIGLPEDVALEILEEYDELEAARSSSEFTAEILSRLEPRTYLRKFRGFERYLSILYLVILMKRYPKSPLQYVEPASVLYARGLITGDASMRTFAENILRYAIWKGEKHREAYNKSLRRYRRTPKARARLEAEIDALLKGIDDE
jgi:hypothetical protein